MQKRLRYARHLLETTHEDQVRKILDSCDIQINGLRPWDLQVCSTKLYKKILEEGSTGFGDAYVNGLWNCADIPELINKALRGNIREKLPFSLKLWLHYLMQSLCNFARWRPYKVGELHYDLGNELYCAMLDKRLTYTCGYWEDNIEMLDEAQVAKLDLVCRKLKLQRGQHVLDVGCGWGSFMKYAAEQYGVKCTGITVSKQQADFVNSYRVNKLLDIEAVVCDWRDVKGRHFDHIVSLGMFEHVGRRNYKEFLQKMKDHLRFDGLFLLHTIGSKKTVYALDTWIEKNIFPNAFIPSCEQIMIANNNTFFIKDWHEFPNNYYERTLLAWYKNICTNWYRLEELNRKKYDERFFRKWCYYLLASAGAFRSGNMLLWQIVLSPQNITYDIVR